MALAQSEQSRASAEVALERLSREKDEAIAQVHTRYAATIHFIHDRFRYELHRDPAVECPICPLELAQ